MPKIQVPTPEEVVRFNPKIKTLLPAIQQKCIRHVILCYKAGVPIRITQGRRTFQEQEQLWLKGRDLVRGVPDNDYIVAEGKIVTKVRKYGWHTLDQVEGALAYDVVLLILNSNGTTKTVTWEKGDRDQDGIDDWKEVADLGVEAGMDAGFYWKKFMDVPHFERHQGLLMADAIRRHEGGLYVASGKPIPKDTGMA